ncbi:MAG: DNA-formamidopyrimidine glycosylase [Bacilli bacterium]|nr:DNA-formamidopyrimidine glycosylase [Bacilli bacterium]
MPELPEVETVRNTLKRKVLNKTITRVDILYDKIIKTDLATFKNNLVNQTIIDIERKGKYLLFKLNDYYLISHLRMEGKYSLKKATDAIEKHTHVIFHFADDTELRYLDVRKFGTMHLKPIEKVYMGEPLEKLGLEPFDEGFTVAYLKSKFTGNRPIKNVLLDQEIIAGLGNIYVNEILFLAKLHPEKPVNQLTEQNLMDIIEASKVTLEKAIKLGGTTIRSYTSDDNVTGRFQNELLVHGKVNEPCPVCQTPIIKIKVSGRGTYLCPHCQKL